MLDSKILDLPIGQIQEICGIMTRFPRDYWVEVNGEWAEVCCECRSFWPNVVYRWRIGV